MTVFHKLALPGEPKEFNGIEILINESAVIAVLPVDHGFKWKDGPKNGTTLLLSSGADIYVRETYLEVSDLLSLNVAE